MTVGGMYRHLLLDMYMLYEYIDELVEVSISQREEPRTRDCNLCMYTRRPGFRTFSNLRLSVTVGVSGCFLESVLSRVYKQDESFRK